jgi:FkbM family methyltransferase
MKLKGKAIRFIKALTSLSRKQAWGPFTEAYEATKFNHAFSVSWSQAGEDLALMPVIGSIPNGRYLDIGAHHPSRFSVTRHLFQNGWSGVNVDANVDLLDAFKRERNGDININYCVGPETTYAISIFKEPAISTVNPDWAARFQKENNEVLETREVPGITLNTLIKDYFPSGGLDFLNIDIEGADLDALRSAHFEELPLNLWPTWILVEANAPFKNTINTASVEMLIKYGYSIHLVLPYAALLRKPDFRN